MRAALLAVALILVGTACSNATHRAQPYSPNDMRWLKRLYRWDGTYWDATQKMSSTYRAVLDRRVPLSSLRKALRPLDDCSRNLRRKVGSPESETLRKAFDLLSGSCEEDRKSGDALARYAVEIVGPSSFSEGQGGPIYAESNAWAKAQRLRDRAYRLIQDGLRANRALPVRDGMSKQSRIEPRLSRAASRLVLVHVEIRCWSSREWRPMLSEWNAYSGNASDLAGFANPPVRANLAPEYCARLARFLYRGWRPADPSGLSDAADAIELVAHEAQHLLDTESSEAVTECYAIQNVRKLARLLGAPRGYAARLSVVYWTQLYPLEPAEYRTKDCRNDGLYDVNPDTNVFP